jgi:hypothetical protein
MDGLKPIPFNARFVDRWLKAVLFHAGGKVGL